MPPQTEITPSSNPNIQSPELQQPPEKRSRKKLILIVVGALLALIIILMFVKSHNVSTRKSKSPTNDSSIYHFRDGYDIEQYGSTIGDPLALDLAKLEKGRKSIKGNIVYACNVVTIGDINSQKMYLNPRSDDRAVMRNFIDDIGQQGVKAEPYSVTDGEKGNSCDYSLQSGGILTVDVYQTPFNSSEAIKDYINRRFAKTTSVGGLDTYKLKDDYLSLSQYLISSGEDAVVVQFNGTGKKVSDEQKSAILNTAASNFKVQQQHAKGPAIVAYSSPTYTKKWARACDFISNADIKSLTGKDASIYASEGLASGTGVEKVNDKLYNSITTSCSRFNVDLGSGLLRGPFDQKLEVQITSYQDEAPAEAGMQDVRKSDTSAIAASIGSEGIAYKDSAGQNTVLFRQGRFIVQVVFDRTVQSNAGLTDTSAMLKKLTPYAQTVATKLKSLE
jgi:hypothetical protein